METVESTNVEAAIPVDVIRETLEAHPVRLAVLFGSHARKDVHARSDIDIAVELDGLQPGQPGYNDTFFGLSADLSEALGTDDVDILDVHVLSRPLVRSVFRDGILLVGTERRAETLREQLESATEPDRSPRERLDEALRRIDDHLA